MNYNDIIIMINKLYQLCYNCIIYKYLATRQITYYYNITVIRLFSIKMGT